MNSWLRYRDQAFTVVRTASRGVNGTECHYAVSDTVERGAIFGMIRIGSQVDLIVPAREDPSIKVEPGDTVRPGGTIPIQ